MNRFSHKLFVTTLKRYNYKWLPSYRESNSGSPILESRGHPVLEPINGSETCLILRSLDRYKAAGKLAILRGDLFYNLSQWWDTGMKDGLPVQR